MSYYRSTQLYAQLNNKDFKTKDTEENENKPIKREESSVPEIHLDEIGEASTPPDRIKCTITCENVKESVEAVKQSVIRRLEYIEQTLKNNQLKALEQYKIHKLITPNDEGGYRMIGEVMIQFPTIDVYEKTVNFLVEKLEASIKISKPMLSYSEGSLTTLRRQASLNAIRNCRSKALTIAQYLNQTLGAALLIREDECSEYSALSNATVEPGTSVQEQMDVCTVTAVVKVHAVFQCHERKKKQR